MCGIYCLGARAGAVSGALVWFSFVCLVMIFSGFINRGQHGPGTDESPECRAEKIDGVKTASVNTVPLSSMRKSSRICNQPHLNWQKSVRPTKDESMVRIPVSPKNGMLHEPDWLGVKCRFSHWAGLIVRTWYSFRNCEKIKNDKISRNQGRNDSNKNYQYQ